ncbi:MAG: hypothetical protein Q9206_005013 [Seirophora lacunosa]
MSSHNDIVLFHYTFSPFAKRITWYLALRGIHYAQCLQPPTLPREDVNALGVKYRRIPILSIGRDIYCDTRLILDKLEERFPSGKLGASQPEQKAIEKLLEKWTVDGVFPRAAQLIPPALPMLNDSKFVQDRGEFTGRGWAKSAIAEARPEALAHMREFFQMLESTILADGRDWILKSEKPTLADIHTVKEAEQNVPKCTTLKGAEAVKHISQAEFAEPDGTVDDQDPLGLKKGQDVESWPIDSGFNHRDRGQLFALTRQEVVLTTQAKVGHRDIHIHHPRTNFRIRAVGDSGSKL